MSLFKSVGGLLWTAGNKMPKKKHVAAGNPGDPPVDPLNAHTPGTEMYDLHEAMLDLVRSADATVYAVQDGNWANSSTWNTGVVPTTNDRVIVPAGVTVTYNASSFNVLHSLGVFGTLNWATDVNTHLAVLNFVSTGTVNIGTLASPITATAEIVFPTAAMDPVADPFLLGRGALFHGTTRIQGATKTPWLRVAADPLAGHTTIQLASVPTNWQVGDVVVIAGTYYEGYRYNPSAGAVIHHPNQDEIRRIKAIVGDTITLGSVADETVTQALVNNHAGVQKADSTFTKTVVGNYTRNITFASGDYLGVYQQTDYGVKADASNPPDPAIFQRGHVMFMHSQDAHCRYAEFHELGRTNKNIDTLFSTTVNGEIYSIYGVQDPPDFNSPPHALTPKSATSNARGRYPVHFHMSGIADQDNPSILEGCAVWGSPGWGATHHNSHTDFLDNCSFNCFGAHYVAEQAGETGVWDGNLAIYAKGINWASQKNAIRDSHPRNDAGQHGAGNSLHGRGVTVRNSVSTSCNTGFDFWHRFAENEFFPLFETLIPFDLFPPQLATKYPFAARWSDPLTDNMPILEFENNECFASQFHTHVEKSRPRQRHDIMTHFKNLLGWSMTEGISIGYTGHYLLEDVEMIGKPFVQHSEAINGINFGPSSRNMTMLRPKISGYRYGISTLRGETFNFDQADAGYVVVEPTFSGNTTADYRNIGPSGTANQVWDTGEILLADCNDIVIASSASLTSTFTVTLTPPGTAADPLIYDPTTSFTSQWTGAAGAKGINVQGTKVDSVGSFSLNIIGFDEYQWAIADVINTLENDGFWTSGSDYYFRIAMYWTDRGQIDTNIKETWHWVRIPPSAGITMGSGQYANAINNGAWPGGDPGAI